ncbi:MAG: sigma-70 family RNA polymerase sigma factor [Patescibacteria group bacterium]|nr:sigma-70 family RNA polymerase sigma factor [Patescibacteria group bacterium]
MGEQEEFDRKVAPHLKGLFRKALYFTGRRVEDAEDLMQETLLTAFSSRSTFEGGTNFHAWISKIMYNTNINRLRKGDLTPLIVEYIPHDIQDHDILMIGDEPSDVSDPQEVAFRNSLSKEVIKALKKLSEDSFLVVYLSFQGFAYEEIAKILNIPIGTVKSKMYRANKTLKNELSDYVKKRDII